MAKSKHTTPAPKSSAAPRVKPPEKTAPRHDGPGQAPKPQVTMTLSHDQIARKAYEIWLAKGRPMGQEQQNWREAEAALSSASS